jgi:hypothetical protein
MGQEKLVENTSEFWADVSMVVVSPVAIAAGFAKGAYDASTDNGAFSEGFNSAAGPIMKEAKKFGAEHSAIITRGVLTGAAGAFGARMVNIGLKRLIG